jgi:hypothetical protein
MVVPVKKSLQVGKFRDRKLKPIAAIGHPPTDEANGDGGKQTPQKGQSNVRD